MANTTRAPAFTKDMVVVGKIAYVSDLLKRIKRLAQPRVLRVKTPSGGSTGGNGYNSNNRRKDFPFGNNYIIIMAFVICQYIS